MKEHIQHYSSLIGILIVTVAGYFVFSFSKEYQLALITAASLAYVTWGITHHYIHKDLSIQVIIEYMVVASLGFVLGVSVIFRA